MTIPNLPTDNLYKFMALSGVLIALVSQYFLVAHSTELAMRVFDTQQAIRIGLRNADAMEERIAKRKQRIEAYEKKPTAETYSELLTLDAELHTDLHGLSVEGVKHDFELKRLNLLLMRSRFFGVVSILATIAGYITAITGFLLWYRRVQVPLDVILQRQYSDALNSSRPAE